MAEYDNNLRGVIFKNDRQENDRSPGYKGSCEINGQKFWISAWVKEGAKGKFFSLSFQPAEKKEEPYVPAVGDDLAF